ncbi:hypothetical protein Hanom_Chr10g00891701 [Helianthus anomalus]
MFPLKCKENICLSCWIDYTGSVFASQPQTLSVQIDYTGSVFASQPQNTFSSDRLRTQGQLMHHRLNTFSSDRLRTQAQLSHHSLKHFQFRQIKNTKSGVHNKSNLPLNLNNRSKDRK